MPYVFANDDPRIVAQLAGNAGEFRAGQELDQSQQAWQRLGQSAAAQQAAQAIQQQRLQQQADTADAGLTYKYDALDQSDQHFYDNADNRLELQKLRDADAEGRLTTRGQQRLEQLNKQEAAAAARQQAGIDAADERLNKAQVYGDTQGQLNRDAAGQRNQNTINAAANRQSSGQQFKHDNPPGGGVPEDDRAYRIAVADWKLRDAFLNRQLSNLNAKYKAAPSYERDGIGADMQQVQGLIRDHQQQLPPLPRQQQQQRVEDPGPPGAMGEPGQGEGAMVSPDGTVPTIDPAQSANLPPAPATLVGQLAQEAMTQAKNNLQLARSMFERWIFDAGFNPHSPAAADVA